ncbi:lysM domain receptor-like kinase 4 [Coffea eugenioides]|uniref:lysM domain receptor-like kinase 4 n=1 Tax=Coffea eugenioides TaxID=49369 RepID=UPI000F61418A|nr:lysM domain receptor-like kinase 4 [Coffea eugenioides]
MVTVAKLLTKNQADDGVKYLLSYSITWGQYVSAISSMFGVDTGKTLQANGLSEQNFNIYPFTTLLVPLQNSPSSSQIVKPPPPSSQQSPPRQRLQIGLDVATGLNYLHSYTSPPHMHKKLKSSNVLVDADFWSKINNFGLAKSADGQGGQFALTRHWQRSRCLDNGGLNPEAVMETAISGEEYKKLVVLD